MSELVSSLRGYLDSLPQWAKAAIGAAVIIIPASRYFQKKVRDSPYKKDFAPGVVYLYQFPRAGTIPNISPFCIKLETWLRMADVNYKNVETPLWLRSKEGMLPFVELDGVEYADSAFIMRDLLKLCKKESTESHLTSEQRGAARAFDQMAENSTMQSYVYVRYGEHIHELFSEKVMGQLYNKIPFFMRLTFQPWLIKRGLQKRLEAHGIGKHSREEIINIGLDDLKAISNYLGDKLYLTGAKPIRADATMFGLLSQIIYIPIETEHLAFVKKECPNLVTYSDRIKRNFWPDWEETCKSGALDTKWKKGQ